VLFSPPEPRTTKFYGVTVTIPNVTARPIDCRLTMIVYKLLYFRSMPLDCKALCIRKVKHMRFKTVPD